MSVTLVIKLKMNRKTSIMPISPKMYEFITKCSAKLFGFPKTRKAINV